jgi:type IV pilus assembly protein PilM
MAARQPGVWGIDLGQCGLKAIRLEEVDGRVTATAFDYVEHPRIIGQFGADPGELIREALEKFLSRNKLRGDTVAISVPGQSGLARFLKLPPIKDQKLAEIVRFEARLQIPFPLDEVVWDFQKLAAGVVQGGISVGMEVGLFAMKRGVVTSYLQYFKEVGVEVDVVQMAPLALYNFACHELLAGGGAAGGEEKEAGEHLCTAALDVGADSSNLVITDGEKIIWQRPIPLGGNHFTRALTKDLKLTFAKAEHLKRNLAKSPELRKAVAALKPILGDFANEVQRSLGFFSTMHARATVGSLVGMGNAFRLPGLGTFLQEKLQLDVKKLEGLRRLAGEEVTAAPAFTENALTFAVAYGLALQGLGQARIQTNLLPQEVRTERLVRAKKPWAVAAAVALVVAVAGLAIGRSAEYRALVNPGVKGGLEKGDKTLKRAKDLVNQYAAQEEAVARSVRAAADIVGEVDQRFNWHLVYKYVHDALPRPDGSRLVVRTRRNAAPREEYDTPDARQAYQMSVFREMTPPATGGPEAEAQRRADTFIKQKLIQVSIEGIASLYADDLPGSLFQQLGEVLKDRPLPGLTEAERRLLTSPAERAKLPRSGWVFEVRGWTYHEKGADFVLNTLVENLANPEAPGLDRKLSKDMKERVKDRLGFVCLYAADRRYEPAPGPVARASSLQGLVRVTGPAAARAAAKGLARADWGPLGTIARGALAGGAGPGPGDRTVGGRKERPADAGGRPARTEFAILFVWQEPLADGQGPRPADMGDDDDD